MNFVLKMLREPELMLQSEKNQGERGLSHEAENAELWSATKLGFRIKIWEESSI